MSIKAMKHAIEAWDACGRYPDSTSDIEHLDVAINALRTAIQQATQPAEVTDDQIESCALEAGFSVESTGSIWAVDGYVGTRVDPGLRKFAKAFLALRPVQVPMTDEQRQTAWQVAGDLMTTHPNRSWRDCICDAIEAHHGITAQAKKETP